MKRDIEDVLHINDFLLTREAKEIMSLNQQIALAKADLQACLDQIRQSSSGADDLATGLNRQRSLPAMVKMIRAKIDALEAQRAPILARISKIVARGEVLKTFEQ